MSPVIIHGFAVLILLRLRQRCTTHAYRECIKNSSVILSQREFHTYQILFYFKIVQLLSL